MKTIKVNHVVLTMKIHPSGGGLPRDEVDEMVNKRLAEGYDTVDIYPVKTNFREGGDPIDLTQLYIFKAFEQHEVGSESVGEVSRGPGRPKKTDA